MRKLVEEFHQDFTRTYNSLRKKAKLLIKLRKQQEKSNSYVTKDTNVTKDFENAKLW